MALRALGYLLLSILGLLLIICILYAVVFQTPKRPTAVTPTRTNLTTPARVLTFNIFMRPPGVHNNADDYKDERLAYILNDILPNYDIIALQEAFAFGNHRVDRLIDTALDLGFDYISSVRHGPWSLASDGGLVLLSRFKVLQADTLEYPRGQHSDWLAFKGALHLLVDLDGTSHLHVYTTHTQASYGGHGERTKADILTRLDQFSRFRQFMVQTSAPGTPLLALGDFNIDSAAHDGDNTSPSTNSSLAYTMMMDVLNGKGVDGAYFGMDGWLLAAPDDGSNAGHPLEWIDMLYERYGYHPVTFGDYRRTDNGTLVPAETALTQAQQVMTAQSIDQLLWSPSSVPNASHVTLSAVTIERFLVDHEPFTQLSDHYGVSCELT
ncbi:hypothetical protein DM01DRAFT_252332 [Hesseltinella vesiculosa]|uniref:sphingomyelin phosphodiesterase n=1 Tax=Hesseltinella vesiculosa TaxID=101127 RepID=A0A1X2GL08_9FUNG|nr:hypothetical protein DM01DRAFT_252332 [Hesseltinella vesiculosa]